MQLCGMPTERHAVHPPALAPYNWAVVARHLAVRAAPIERQPVNPRPPKRASARARTSARCRRYVRAASDTRAGHPATHARGGQGRDSLARPRTCRCRTSRPRRSTSTWTRRATPRSRPSSRARPHHRAPARMQIRQRSSRLSGRSGPANSARLRVKRGASPRNLSPMVTSPRLGFGGSSARHGCFRCRVIWWSLLKTNQKGRETRGPSRTKAG